MTFAELLASRIIEVMTRSKLTTANTDVILEALKMVIDITATVAVDELERAEPVVHARIRDVGRAIKDLQIEIMEARENHAVPF